MTPDRGGWRRPAALRLRIRGDKSDDMAMISSWKGEIALAR